MYPQYTCSSPSQQPENWTYYPGLQPCCEFSDKKTSQCRYCPSCGKENPLGFGNRARRVPLRDVLWAFPHAVPGRTRTRYSLEADFRELQRWRGRMSGLWRRFRSASRDAEIRRLVGLGNSYRSVAFLYGMAASTVHHIVWRRLARISSTTGGLATVRTAPDPLSLTKRICFSRGSSNSIQKGVKIYENTGGLKWKLEFRFDTRKKGGNMNQ